MSSTRFENNAAVTRNSTVIHTESGDEILALNPESGNCYSFSGPSARLWQVLAEPTTAAEAAAVLAAEFEIEEEACREQIAEFFTRLNDEQLIRIAPEAA